MSCWGSDVIVRCPKSALSVNAKAPQPLLAASIHWNVMKLSLSSTISGAEERSSLLYRNLDWKITTVASLQKLIRQTPGLQNLLHSGRLAFPAAEVFLSTANCLIRRSEKSGTLASACEWISSDYSNDTTDISRPESESPDGPDTPQRHTASSLYFSSSSTSPAFFSRNSTTKPSEILRFSTLTLPEDTVLVIPHLLYDLHDGSELHPEVALVARLIGWRWWTTELGHE